MPPDPRPHRAGRAAALRQFLARRAKALLRRVRGGHPPRRPRGGDAPGAAIADRDAAHVRALRARGVTIGERCRIYSHDFSTEPYLITIGDNVGIAGGVKFLTHDGAAHLLRHRRAMAQSLGRIEVGDDCFIGENALLLPGTSIGRGCVIAAGAVARGRIPDNALVAGNPGRVIGRASLYLERMLVSENCLDSFGLPEPARRDLILARLAARPADPRLAERAWESGDG